MASSASTTEKEALQLFSPTLRSWLTFVHVDDTMNIACNDEFLIDWSPCCKPTYNGEIRLFWQ